METVRYLEVAARSAERVVGQRTLLVEKLAGPSVARRVKEPVVEALLQLLDERNKSGRQFGVRQAVNDKAGVQGTKDLLSHSAIISCVYKLRVCVCVCKRSFDHDSTQVSHQSRS